MRAVLELIGARGHPRRLPDAQAEGRCGLRERPSPGERQGRGSRIRSVASAKSLSRARALFSCLTSHVAATSGARPKSLVAERRVHSTDGRMRTGTTRVAWTLPTRRRGDEFTRARSTCGVLASNMTKIILGRRNCYLNPNCNLMRRVAASCNLPDEWGDWRHVHVESESSPEPSGSPLAGTSLVSMPSSAATRDG